MKYLHDDIKNIFYYFIISIFSFYLSYLCFKLNIYLGFIISILIFGRLQIYFSEILHEATHFNFFRTFKLNDLLTNIILFPFLLITVQQNRKSHFIHHSFQEGNNFFTDDDPDTHIYNPNDFNIKNILSDLFGFTTLRLFLSKNKKNSTKFTKNYIAHLLYAICFWSCIIFFNNLGTKIIICWGIAALSIYSFLSRVRIYLMHKNVNDSENISRNINSDLISNLFISKMMLNHDLHHQYPSLPFRKLNNMAIEKKVKVVNALDVLKSF